MARRPMASHTVALDGEAHAALKAMKGRDESFSDVVKRIAKPRKSILDLAGAWKELPAADRKALEAYYAQMEEGSKRRARRSA